MNILFYTLSNMLQAWSKLSGFCGNCLLKIENMVENEYGVTAANKPMLQKLMSNNLLLYPSKTHVSFS
jgi:hypothetical protein